MHLRTYHMHLRTLTSNYRGCQKSGDVVCVLSSVFLCLFQAQETAEDNLSRQVSLALTLIS